MAPPIHLNGLGFTFIIAIMPNIKCLGTFKGNKMKLSEIVAEQEEFVNWLKEEEMYNKSESPLIMLKMFDIWKVYQKSMKRLERQIDHLYCEKCGTQSKLKSALRG